MRPCLKFWNIERMFAVIEFSPSQGGSLAVINKDWLTPRKREVFWPPYKDQKQFNRSLRQSEAINTETWGLYNVQRIFYETDDYEKAVEKCKQAEITSDLQTDIEENNFIRKRKRVRPVRFDSTSEDTDEETRNLPAPPPIKKAFSKDITASTTLFTPSSSPANQLHLQSATTLTSTPLTRETKKLTVEDQILDSKVLTEKSGFQVLLENLIEIKNLNKQILGYVTTLMEKEKGKDILLPEEFPVHLPLTDIQQLTKLEEFLKEPTHAKALITYFSGLGGNNLSTQTNKILKATLTDSLASEYNYFGRKAKKAFKDLKISSCITDAVKLSRQCTSTDVEYFIKVWLKHAPQRLKKRSQ